jgi:hypothetical protein
MVLEQGQFPGCPAVVDGAGARRQAAAVHRVGLVFIVCSCILTGGVALFVTKTRSAIFKILVF